MENYEQLISECWVRTLTYFMKYKIYANRKEMKEGIALVTDLILHVPNISSFVEDHFLEYICDKIAIIAVLKKKEINVEKIENGCRMYRYDILQTKDRFFMDIIHKMRMKKGMKLKLISLKEEHKLNLCFIHKESRVSMNAILNDFGIKGYFHRFVCSQSISDFSYPYKQLYKQMMSKCGILNVGQQCICLLFQSSFQSNTNHEISEIMECNAMGIPYVCNTQQLLQEKTVQYLSKNRM